MIVHIVSISFIRSVRAATLRFVDSFLSESISMAAEEGKEEQFDIPDLHMSTNDWMSHGKVHILP